jgi:alpha-galactosidase
MKRLFFIHFFVCLSVSILAQQNPVITAVESPKGWLLKTNSSAYQVMINATGIVKLGYYGSSAQASYQSKNAAWSEAVDEVPVRGGTAFKTPALEVIYADGVRDAELLFVSGEVVTIEGRPTLKIIQKDRIYPLEVISYIRVISEYDIIEKWIEVKNGSKKDKIKVENLQSGSVTLPGNEYVLTQLSGRERNEFQPYQSLLVPGLRTIQNKSFKANFNAPWFQVRPKSSNDDELGPTWFGVVHYSGNWTLAFDQNFNAGLQILGGINFWDTSLDLKPGQTFTTPKLTLGYTEQGNDGVAVALQAYVRKEILPEKFRMQPRPVLYNSWYATTYAVKEDQQVEMAKTAAEIGIEYFVIDDGWFKGRTKSDSGLGDWEVDKTKFPNGLTSMIQRINDLGMKFGIWIEPESVNLKTDVYRQHPDWILSFPNRRKELPYRVFLNLAKEEVYQHLLNSFTKLLKENKIDFIKWDQNTYLTEPGWMDAPIEVQREVRIRYVENLYRLITELRKRFPNVWFESCASGGGRVDYGMMSKMDQQWTSDEAIALNRIFIQYGYLNFLPANTMVSWVIDQIGSEWQQPTSLSYKFDVSMAGVLGIGSDIRKWTTVEKEIAKAKIALYKKIRPLVQQGVNYRLASPFESNRCALQYNAEDKNSAVVICYNLAKYLPQSQLVDRGSSVLPLKGLDPLTKYLVKKAEDPLDKGTVYTGELLMKIGLSWPVKNSFESQILLINKVD